MNTPAFIEKHAAAIDRTRKALAMDFDTPAQRTINRLFAEIGVQRFTRSGDDLWEMIVAHQNGWEYQKPPAYLIARWGSY
jgi:hypothetical protein